MVSQLKVVAGGLKGVTVRLRGPRVLVGHSRDCQVRLTDLAVAERRCEVVVGATHLAVRDLGSPAGTTLNGLRMAPGCLARARPGDRVAVGGCVLEVVADHDQGDDGPGEAAAAVAAGRLLQQRLGPPRRLSRAERGLVATRDLAGIPVHAVGLRYITDRAAARTWRAVLAELAARPGPGRLVLELRAVEEVSVEAVDVLLAFRRRLEAAGAAVKACDARPSVEGVLHETGADRLIPVYLDASEAVWSRW